MKEAIVSVRDLSKSYGPVVGVSGVSFELRRGEIMGLLGPNGAGKTTTLECLEGIRQPDSGTMRILGINPSRESRRLCNVIGVQLQTSGLPPTHAMQAFEGLAFGRETVLDPGLSLLILASSGALAFLLAVYLFSWDSRNATRRGHPLLGLLALAPYVIAFLLG